VAAAPVPAPVARKSSAKRATASSTSRTVIGSTVTSRRSEGELSLEQEHVGIAAAGNFRREALPGHACRRCHDAVAPWSQPTPRGTAGRWPRHPPATEVTVRSGAVRDLSHWPLLLRAVGRAHHVRALRSPLASAVGASPATSVASLRRLGQHSAPASRERSHVLALPSHQARSASDRLRATLRWRAMTSPSETTSTATVTMVAPSAA
jgi:hypothetical protein